MQAKQDMPNLYLGRWNEDFDPEGFITSAKEAIERADVLEQLADVDWLTITSKNKDIRNRMWQEANRIMHILKEQGFAQKPWRFSGYDGWLCGGFRWGTREDSDICMLSGENARVNYDVMLGHCENVTRIDLAVTITLCEPMPTLAFDTYALNAWGTGRGDQRKRKASFINNSDGGQTLYLGSRASDQYGRIYDKGMENQDRTDVPVDLGRIWRYEVEFKSYRAKRIASQLYEKLHGELDVHSIIGDTVDTWFKARGLPTIIKNAGDQPFLSDVRATVTDDAMTLKWLSTQVRPSVSRLILNGRLEDVLRALNIDVLDRTGKKV